MRPLWASQARLFEVVDPDIAIPDSASNRAYFSPAGPFWQDVARTTPATTTGDPVKAWDDLSGLGQHLIWQSGPVSTLAAGGGIDCPAGSIMTSAATTTGTSWSFYIWSDAPSPSALNFLVGELAGTGPQIAPMHLAGDTYFGTAASNYQTIADTGTEKLRGMSMAGATGTCFVGGSWSTLGLNAVTVPSFTLNDDASYQQDHVIRFIVLRNVADDHATTNAYRRHVSRLLYPVNPSFPVKRVVVNIHYEGQTAPSVGSGFNNAMLLARAQIPFAKFTHCFSPIYETAGGSHATIAAGVAPLVFAGQDTFGMHVHQTYSLPTAAGVTALDHPTSSSPTTPDGTGYNVLLTAYGLADSTTVFTYAAGIISSYGYGTPTVFTAGNWITDADVRQALAACGFTHDVSAIPASLVTGLPAYLQGLIAAEWPSLTTTSQPYDIATGSGNLRQLVANCGMCSYDTAAAIGALLIAIPTGSIGVVSCHFEDASGLADLATALLLLEADAVANSYTVEYIRAEAA